MGSGEGELNKRLLRLEMFDLSRNENERDLVDSKQVATVLEEAKADFPSMILGKPAIFQKETDHEKGYTEGYYSARKEVYEWFERWFGSVASK